VVTVVMVNSVVDVDADVAGGQRNKHTGLLPTIQIMHEMCQSVT
jgi:hypothetical protein